MKCFKLTDEEIKHISKNVGEKIKELGYSKVMCDSLIVEDDPVLVIHLLVGYQKLDIFISAKKDKGTGFDYHTVAKYFYPTAYTLGTINDDRQYELASLVTVYHAVPCMSREAVIEEILCDFPFLPIGEYIDELHSELQNYFTVDIRRRT